MGIDVKMTLKLWWACPHQRKWHQQK